MPKEVRKKPLLLAVSKIQIGNSFTNVVIDFFSFIESYWKMANPSMQVVEIYPNIILQLFINSIS